MAFTLTLSDVAAFLALIVAVWSVIQTTRFNKRQNAFAETAQRLNEMLIAREAADAEGQQAADVSANFIKIGKNDCRLKIFNRGPGVARNVRLEMLRGGDLLSRGEVEKKFPLAMLERQQNVDLICFVHLGSDLTMEVRLLWDDDKEQGRSKELVLHL
ncbi:MULTISPECIES: hypothetical protein [unclassified Sphingopyxis]|uniref:hypothetical protein n=1 Tax=unclassified Sphingopyxis TaxID=2614943 RepID=UPI00073680AF|nr:MULTISPECIES: hypothetical protein [unclassified Sphingopyxis]KTE42416.1 hypothetical protein ATE62_05175 [Sphingopyxis sp. HIX]KTE85421.1 hypothetical protein ATE72_04035 [Sphingopyxis sp. HXXIV]